MKTILIFLTLLFQSFNSAANTIDTEPAHEAFSKHFSTATDVEWEETTPFLCVRFNLNNQVMEAVYKNTGELVSVMRNISSDQLPLLLGWEARIMLKNNWINSLKEVVSGNDHYYLIVIENSEREAILKSTSDRDWVICGQRNK